MTDTGGVSVDGDPGFYATLRAAIDDGHSPDEAVDLVIDSEEFRGHMRTLLKSQVSRMVRNQNRAGEQRAVEQWKAGNVHAAKRELIGRTFALPSGRLVDWANATATEHRERAQWQRLRAQSIDRDARLHEIAAQLIDDAGVDNLGQIKSLAPWPELAELT